MENTYIRPPDEVKREQILEDNRSDFDKQIDEALYLSLKELREQEEINKIYEDEIFNDYLVETKNRKEMFHELLVDLQKLVKFDKDIKEIYDILDPVIDTYCAQYIQHFELDQESYDRIFKVLGTIRTNKKNIELVKLLIKPPFTV